MNNTPYQSSYYPSLSQLIEITASDYSKLRRIMSERGELEKFIKWQKHKFIKLTTQIPINHHTHFNPSIYNKN